MSRFWHHFVSNGIEWSSACSSAEPVSDGHDGAESLASLAMTIAQKLRPVVATLGRRDDREGGAGVLITDDGLVLTSHSAVRGVKRAPWV